ncbi:MAG: formate--tetrahydrofolate ligase [Thiolinea sp.]
MSVRNPKPSRLVVPIWCVILATSSKFGVPVVVAINRFVTDTDAELDVVSRAVAEYGVEAVTCTHWADGGAGTEALANKVVKLVKASWPSLRRCMT